MKTRSILWIIMGAIVLGLSLWWRSPLENRAPSVTTQPGKSALDTTVGPKHSPSTTNLTASLQVVNQPDTANSPAPATLPEVKIPENLPDSDKMQMILNAQNSQAINAYGKVIDQYGAPVAGVEVTGGTLLTAADGTSSQTSMTVTDGQGRFNFLGLHGSYFGVGFKKEGYEFNPRLYLSWWGKYKYDPNNPIVFTMYKLQGAEPMVKARLPASLPVDGRETHFDLLTGQKVATGGDFTVKLTRNPINIEQGKPFDWTVTFTVPSGGLIAVADAYPNEAPGNGYQPSIIIDMPANAKNWTDSYDGFYYLKARGGQIYGRIKISLSAGYQPPPTYFGADVYANPAGSRNLEYDRNKRIDVPGAVPLINLD